MTIGPAYGPFDLTIHNPQRVMYLSGDEFTDGSFRLEPADEHTNFPHLELRADGIWEDTGLTLSPDTLFFGDDVSLGGVGSHLQVNSTEGNSKSLLLEVVFDDAGTGQPHTHVLGPLQERVVFSSNETGQITGSLFELPATSFLTAFRYKYYFKTGSVAATSPVTMELSKGSTPGGVIIFRTTMPASQWTANTEVVIELVGALSLTIGAPLLLTMRSDNDFSLIGDPAQGGLFFAMDFQAFSLEDVLSIPTGINRFIVNNTAQLMVDNSGHLIMFGKQGSLDTTTPAPAFPPLSDPPPPGV